MFLNLLEFSNVSVAITKFSVSENGANPTPNDVSLDAGIPSLLKTSTKSPEPCPILHSTTAEVSTSRFIIFSFK